jgi:hypothetical protein
MTHYLIWSIEQCAWRKSGGWGYTTVTHAAGRYDYEEAYQRMEDANRDGGWNELAVAAPTRMQMDDDLLALGLDMKRREKADDALAPSSEVTAPGKAPVNAGEDDRLPEVPWTEDVIEKEGET